MAANAVGLAIGCVGFRFLCGRHHHRLLYDVVLSLANTYWLVVACSSVLQFHAAIPSRCTISAVLEATLFVQEPWQFAIVSELLLPFISPCRVD